ncbi:MAG: arsinothricin resistance N-acetyltransferase ArsN1 family B [Pseudomonadota bacterium]
MRIRSATAADASAILAIYGPIVEQTAISFETEVPTAEAMAERIERARADYAFVVAETDDRCLGYAYAGVLRLRAAYRASVETSVYVAENAHRRGIAGSLYQALFGQLNANGSHGFHTALAAITLPNDASVHFHEAFGFKAVGRFREVGYKFGRWHDVGWWQRHLSS